jgi:hypothetical protein
MWENSKKTAGRRMQEKGRYICKWEVGREGRESRAAMQLTWDTIQLFNIRFQVMAWDLTKLVRKMSGYN